MVHKGLVVFIVAVAIFVVVGWFMVDELTPKNSVGINSVEEQQRKPTDTRVSSSTSTTSSVATRAPLNVKNVVLASGPLLLQRVREAGGIAAVCTMKGRDVDGLQRWKSYLDQVCGTLYTQRKRSLAGDPRSEALRVLIIGAGPVGLMNALVAYSRGVSPVVVEKRSVFNRDVWFDLTDGAWGPSLSLLRKWGMMQLFDELDTDQGWTTINFDHSEETEQMMMLRCEMMQRFLAQTCLLLGVGIEFGLTFDHLNSARNSAVMGDGSTIGFDVILGADGAHSHVRHELGIKEILQTNAKQLSISVEFLKCPGASPGLTHWKLSEHIHDVSKVYLRFGKAECHVQILLTNMLNQPLSKDSATPWDLIFKVMSYALPQEYKTLDELRANVERVHLLDTTLTHSSEATVCCARDCSTIGVLVGDAFFTAYYRLGIGVNNAIDATHNMGVFLQRLAQGRGDTSKYRIAVKVKEHLDMYRLDKLYGHQVKVMWLEAFCAEHVFLEHKNTVSAARSESFKYLNPVDPRQLFCVRIKYSFKEKEPMNVALQKCEKRLGLKSPWKFDKPAPQDFSICGNGSAASQKSGA